MDEKTLLRLAKTHGTPLFVVDHKALRENYGQFRKYLPRVQVYYAVKANSAPEIVRTFYEAGASFDVASVAEFLTVHENVKDLPEEQRQAFIWDRIIYANPIKANETLEQLDPYKPLVTYDNYESSAPRRSGARRWVRLCRDGRSSSRRSSTSRGACTTTSRSGGRTSKSPTGSPPRAGARNIRDQTVWTRPSSRSQTPGRARAD